MKKIIVTICEWATVILAIIGIITLGNVAHELVHYHDVISQNGTVISVCFLKLPLEHEVNKTWLSGSVGEVRAKGDIKSSELKAFSIGVVFMIILAVIMFIGFWGEYNQLNVLYKETNKEVKK